MSLTMLERFIKYVKIDTRSDEASLTVPTTESQVAFAKMLAEDLIDLGLSEVEYLPRNGFVTATLPANNDSESPILGFVAHVDTADYNSKNIQPQIHRNYAGKDIILNEEKGLKMTTAEFPNLKNYLGETLITTDGTTLLGADDKAGIVEIMSGIEYFLAHPEISHGEIRLAFGPDEEIGRGADLFDAKHFRAQYAYTIDSGTVGHLEYETFNAAQAKISIQGTSVHPGTAINSLLNALKLAHEFDALLPADEVPELTKGYEGFYLLHDLVGSIGHAELTYIIRDHDREKFEQRKLFLEEKVNEMNQKYGQGRFEINLHDQYYNMAEVIQEDKYPVDLAVKAMKKLNITPIITPFRGGTDGSKISFMGIPTPNLFTGGENFHGQYEFISLEAMEKTVATIIEIIKLNG